MEMHTAARSRLRWLKEIEPYAFAELVFQRDMRQFAKGYTRVKQQSDLEEQLTVHFQDKSFARAIAREMMMYGN